MRAIIGLFTAGVVAVAAAPLPAQAEEELCFDKGLLDYAPCPQEPAPVIEEPIVEETEYYIGARGGVIWLDDIDSPDGYYYNSQNSITFTSVTNGQNIDYIPSPGAGDDFELGFIVSAMAGVNLDKLADGVVLRPELEIGYFSASFDDDLDDGDVSGFFGFVNLFGDLPVSDDLAIIVGGGVGAGHIDFDADTPAGLSGDDTAFGYNLTAGLGYAVDEDVTIELLYRYVSFIDVEASNAFGSVENDVSGHVVMLGVRAEF